MCSLGHIDVRPMLSADIALVRELHSQLLPIRYPSSFFTQLLLLSGRICLVAHDLSDPKYPVAFISACIRQTPLADHPSFLTNQGRTQSSHQNLGLAPWIEILTIGVLPAFQKRGLARLLVQRVYEHFRDTAYGLQEGSIIQANVATSNATALSFYKHLGMFIVSDVIQNLYRTCGYRFRDAYVVAGFVHNVADRDLAEVSFCICQSRAKQQLTL